MNPDVKLPEREIVVVHRSEASGTTFVWTDYLSKVSPSWSSTLGAGSLIKWPIGLGGRGNEGVHGLVRQTPDSIGYVELSHALQTATTYGSVRNAAGKFLKAGSSSLTEAATTALHHMPEDLRISITNAPGENAYPIASFTWLLVPRKINDTAKGNVIREFLKWMLTSGQESAIELGYAPLPKQIVTRGLSQISQIE